MKLILKLTFILILQLLLTSCATPAWKKYPSKVPPDYSCFYGGAEGGDRYYIWKCLDDKRVVIEQSGFGFWTMPADKYEAACSEKTQIEKERNLDIDQKKCKDKGHWETELKVSQ